MAAGGERPRGNEPPADTGNTGELNTTPAEKRPLIRKSGRPSAGGSLLMGFAFAHAGFGPAPCLGPFLYEIWSCPRPYGGDPARPPGWPSKRSRIRRPPCGWPGSRRPSSTRLRKRQLPFTSMTRKRPRQTREPAEILAWLDQAVTGLFTRLNLATSLQEAGLSPADLDWIAAQEYALGASFAIPKRRATIDGTSNGAQKAWSKQWN